MNEPTNYYYRCTNSHLRQQIGEVFSDDGEGPAAHGEVVVLVSPGNRPATQPLL